jgi:hypothetical protein
MKLQFKADLVMVLVLAVIFNNCMNIKKDEGSSSELDISSLSTNSRCQLPC